MTFLERPKRVKALVTRRLSDAETVVVGPSGSAVLLNEIGAIVLDLCDGTRTVADIATIVSSSVADVPAERVLTDVRSFVAKLGESGCVVEAT